MIPFDPPYFLPDRPLTWSERQAQLVTAGDTQRALFEADWRLAYLSRFTALATELGWTVDHTLACTTKERCTDALLFYGEEHDFDPKRTAEAVVREWEYRTE